VHSLLAFAAAVLLAILAGDGLIWIGLGLLALGALPALLALRARRGGALTLHLGSLVAQTGLIATLIALIPG
jgi:hypothetical protein